MRWARIEAYSRIISELSRKADVVESGHATRAADLGIPDLHGADGADRTTARRGGRSSGTGRASCGGRAGGVPGAAKDQRRCALASRAGRRGGGGQGLDSE